MQILCFSLDFLFLVNKRLAEVLCEQRIGTGLLLCPSFIPLLKCSSVLNLEYQHEHILIKILQFYPRRKNAWICTPDTLLRALAHIHTHCNFHIKLWLIVFLWACHLPLLTSFTPPLSFSLTCFLLSPSSIISVLYSTRCSCLLLIGNSK